MTRKSVMFENVCPYGREFLPFPPEANKMPQMVEMDDTQCFCWQNDPKSFRS